MDISSSKTSCYFDTCAYRGFGYCNLFLMTNDNSPMIDSETCELYIQDSQINTKKYLNEFDPKCMDFKNLNK